MSSNLKASSYPASMLEAFAHAQTHGELIIPTLTPNALRLRFYGLKRALAADNRHAECANVVIRTRDDCLILTNSDLMPETDDIRAALAAAGAKPAPSLASEADAILDRLGL